MRLRRSAAIAALSVATLLPLVGSTVAARGPDPAAARAAAEHARIVAHWTPERMKAAVPRDFAKDPATGRYHLVPMAKPGGGGSGGNTTGASWPNGKGKVYKATGKVYFEMGGGAWVCSGTSLSDGNRANFSLVITAGHCVYDEENGAGKLSGFATNWLFIPQFDSNPTFTCANTAFGCWTATALVVNRGFATAGGFNDQATHYDWGFAVVGDGGKTSGANLQLDATVGTFGYQASAMSANTVVDAFGYPAAQKYKGNDLVYCQGPIGFDSLNANTTYKLPCGMTGGSSGGPWFSGFNASTGDAGTIQSLNSYGYSGQSNMYGPKFNGDTSATYNAATSATSNTIVN
jgi:V8-like Glu-specific endopeptidase